jgi:hypothetical protein
MKGMGYAAEEIEDIAKDPKRIQIATDIIIPDEGLATGGRVGYSGGGIGRQVLKLLGKKGKDIKGQAGEGFDPGKRKFLKGTGAAGLGLTALGTGAVRLGKKTSKKIKDIDIDMGVDVDGDYSDTAERFEAFYNTFFKIKANTKAGKKVLDKLAKEKKIVKEKDGSYSADTMGDIDSPAIDALEDIKNQSSYDLSFEGKKFKNTDEAGDYFRGNTKEASPVKPDYYTVREDEFLTEDMGEVVDILAPKPITKQIKEEVEKRIRNVEREARRPKRAMGGRIEMAGGGITALKTLIRFLGKDSGKKGSQMLKEINPKQFGYKFDMLDPEMKKQINNNRLEYIENLSDSIKADQKLLRGIKDLPEEWQDFMLKQANEGGNQGRLDVYNDIDIDSAVEEIEQLKKNLEFKNIPAKEVKRKMNAEGGRIEMFVGGSVYDQYQNYLNQVNSQSSDPLYSNILYNQPSMNDTGSGNDDIDVTKDQTVGSSKALDYYNNQLGYLGRTGVNSLLGMVNPMLGAVGQMYNQGKSLYDLGSSMFGGVPEGGSFSKNPGIGFSNRDPEDTQDYGGGSEVGPGDDNDPGYDSGDYE